VPPCTAALYSPALTSTNTPPTASLPAKETILEYFREKVLSEGTKGTKRIKGTKGDKRIQYLVQAFVKLQTSLLFGWPTSPKPVKALVLNVHGLPVHWKGAFHKITYSKLDANRM
jgi:hypothetical protein